MLMLRAQERELRKSEGRFNEHLSKKRESTSCGSLPPINQSEVRFRLTNQSEVIFLVNKSVRFILGNVHYTRPLHIWLKNENFE